MKLCRKMYEGSKQSFEDNEYINELEKNMSCKICICVI